MSPSEVSKSYDAIAAQWTDAAFDRENGMAQHLLALQFLPHAGKALDVGCGSSGRFIDLLIERGFEVGGLDISVEMIRLARLRHPQLMFHHADVCAWEPVKHYDFISAWDSVWHVPLAAQEMVWRKLMMALAPGGVMILTTGGVDDPGDVQNAQMGVPMYHAAPGLPSLCRLIAEAGCVIRHLEHDQWPEKHVWLVVQRLL